MKDTKLILQGGGRITLVMGEGTRPDEAGSLGQALRAHMDEGRPVTLFGGIGEIIDNRPVNEQQLTKVVTRDRSTGRYHTRCIEVQPNGDERMLVDERCQTDESGNYDVLEDLPASADYDTMCKFCFPALKT